MGCSGAYATAEDFATMFKCTNSLGPDEELGIELALELSAADIHAAMAAAGACDCTLASWAANYLKKLNCVEGAVFYGCSCGGAKLTDDMKRTWIEWLNTQLEAIRTGKLELCEGSTGSDYPALGWAEIGWTPDNEARIIINEEQRNS
jgi:hypothetical protein